MTARSSADAALLDVNVLIALLDQDHIGHQQARDWIMGNIDAGWASCAITQNGYVRVVSQARYPNAISTTRAMALLRQATDTTYHRFLPCDVSLLDAGFVEADRVHGPSSRSRAVPAAVTGSCDT